MEYLPQMSAKLAIVIVSNATSWDFNDTGSSDIFVVFSPGREKIEVRRWPFTDGNVITFRSAAGTVSNLLGSRFHVGVVVRNGRDISMDICTLLACVSPIRDVRLKNAYELHSDADPKVLMIAARSNQGFVDLLDFKVNSLTGW